MRKQRLFSIVTFFYTLASFYAGLWLAIIYKYPHGLSSSETQRHYLTFSLLYVAWLIVAYSFNLFDVRKLKRMWDIALSLLSAFALNIGLASIFFYAQPSLLLTPRRFLLLHVLLSLGFLAVWYALAYYFFRQYTTENVYVLDGSGQELATSELLSQYSSLGYRYAGPISFTHTLPVIPRSSIVIASLDNVIDPQVAKRVFDGRRIGYTFMTMDVFFEQVARKIFFGTINELWFLINIDYAERMIYRLGKRVIDIVAGIVLGIAFLITAPLVIAINLLTIGRPLFFKQPRIGKGGNIFVIYKYRTMTGPITNTWTQVGDARISKFGKFLRMTKLDELPQFVNLLRGNMSLVGPRPEQVQMVERLRVEIPFYDERHLVKPGITGWAQLHVYAASVEETKEKLAYDLYYVKHRSLLFDIEIILKTGYSILTARGR